MLGKVTADILFFDPFTEGLKEKSEEVKESNKPHSNKGQCVWVRHPFGKCGHYKERQNEWGSIIIKCNNKIRQVGIKKHVLKQLESNKSPGQE